MGELVIEYEPRLVEEAVFVAVRGRPVEREFRRERDRLYDVPDPEEREAGFRALHAAWFERLGLGQGIDRALQEQPSVTACVGRCLVACAPARRDEGAELFVASASGTGLPPRVVVIRLRPETLATRERLRLLLRRELLHIADMLDPRFGYEPRFHGSAVGPARERLLLDRYRVLWEAFVDGRLVRRGWAPAAIRAERLTDFARAFEVLGERMGAAFERFFDGVSATHAELAAFAADPEGPLGGARGGPRTGERCPLCGFPTTAFEPDPDRLPQEVRQRIRASFPAWDPADGLCRQCGDLYRSRVGSRDAGSAAVSEASVNPGG